MSVELELREQDIQNTPELSGSSQASAVSEERLIRKEMYRDLWLPGDNPTESVGGISEDVQFLIQIERSFAEFRMPYKSIRSGLQGRPRSTPLHDFVAKR